jgi:hypothetical protein
VNPLIDAGGPSGAPDAEDVLITRLSTLAPALDGEPDPAWESRTRARLVAMAAVRTPDPRPVSPLRRVPVHRRERAGAWRARLTAGLVGAALAVTAVAAVVSLSADARPGDVLYGFKRGGEQTRLALAGDGRGRTLLDLASTRLDELSAALTDGSAADLVADTLATMDRQTADGAAWLAQRALDTRTGAPLDELSGWSAAQSDGLADVRAEVPAAAEDDAAGSADLLARIDERVDALRVALDCPSGPAIRGSDALGPVPGPCTPPAPPAGAGNPGARVTDQPVPTTVPTPATSSGGAPDAGAGGTSGGADGSAPTSGPGSGPGPRSDRSGLPGLPGVDPLPELPIPDLPTLLPRPDGDARPPARTPSVGTAGSTPGRVTPPRLDVCVPPLPVVGDC